MGGLAQGIPFQVVDIFIFSSNLPHPTLTPYSVTFSICQIVQKFHVHIFLFALIPFSFCLGPQAINQILPKRLLYGTTYESLFWIYYIRPSFMLTSENRFHPYPHRNGIGTHTPIMTTRRTDSEDRPHAWVKVNSDWIRVGSGR